MEKLRTLPACCCAMTVMSAITPIAWTHPCTLYPRVVGSANGKKKNTQTPRPQCLVQLCSLEWGQMEISTCKFAYYVKHSSSGPAIETQRPIPFPFLFLWQQKKCHLYLCFNLTYWLYNCYRVLLYYFAGVYVVCSAVPTHQASTVSGRTTTPTVAHVPASSHVQYAERTSWRRSCCCSVSTVTGGYCSLELHTHTPDTETEVFMKPQLMKTSGE